MTDLVDLCRLKAVNKKTKEQLREHCSMAGFPYPEFSDLKKQELLDYIIGKEFEVSTMVGHLAWLQGR